MLLSKLGKQTICMLMKYNTRKEVQVVTDISHPPQALGGCAAVGSSVTLSFPQNCL